MNFVTQNSKLQIPFKLQDTKFKLLLIAALFVLLSGFALPLLENNVKGDIGQFSVSIFTPTLDMVFPFAIINLLKHTAFLRASGRRQFLFYGK